MQYSRFARAGFRVFASAVFLLFVASLHAWSTEPPIPADAQLSAPGVGTAAKTDAMEAGVLTNAIVPGAASTVENFKRASDYSARNGGRAVLVLVDGKTVFENYDNGFGTETATHLHSATKGFWGPVIAAMIEDGLIESFDELAAKTLTEWKDHPRKSRITLRHLLTLSAGLVQDVRTSRATTGRPSRRICTSTPSEYRRCASRARSSNTAPAATTFWARS